MAMVFEFKAALHAILLLLFIVRAIFNKTFELDRALSTTAHRLLVFFFVRAHLIMDDGRNFICGLVLFGECFENLIDFFILN